MESGRFSYSGEGWGLCFDGGELVMSDGSATLTFRDADDFSIRRQIRVVLGGRPFSGLNELDCAGGRVYANVLQRDEIVRIHPGTGHVEAIIDASELRRRLSLDARSRAGDLNGIAYREETGSFLLTGKRWPTTFEVRFPEGAANIEIPFRRTSAPPTVTGPGTSTTPPAVR